MSSISGGPISGIVSSGSIAGVISGSPISGIVSGGSITGVISGSPVSGIVSSGSISSVVSVSNTISGSVSDGNLSEGRVGGGVLVSISGVVLAVSVPVQISVGSVSGSVVTHVARSVGRRSGVAAMAGAAVHVVSGIVVVGLGAGEDGTQYNQGKLHRELINLRSCKH